MGLNIHSADLTLFTIEYDGETDEQTARLVLEGEWLLNPRIGAAPKWIASARIEWPEALKRSLIALTMKT